VLNTNAQHVHTMTTDISQHTLVCRRFSLTDSKVIEVKYAIRQLPSVELYNEYQLWN